MTWQYRELDINNMQHSVEYLLGEHDFTSFRSLQCQAKTAIRTISHFSIERKREFVVCHIKANAFLHHMVRNMMGALIMVGVGKKDPEWIGDILTARNRTIACATAPPYGLYLAEIEYPQHFELPVFPKTNLLTSLGAL